ncbi:MAG: hemerythrin family protein [Alphaproteobacteria bacterium]|nr:hemerythrin family protein [Alphaproteobacteria bacterium]MBF0394538.1 hemerythrin family protein [Alphaproteobacteria bacterium]
MAEIRWRDEYSVDIVSIDQQHQGLTSEFLALMDLLRGDAPVADKLDAFDRFTVLVRDHFRHEENIMRNIGFRRFDAHKQQHDSLLADVGSFRANLGGMLEHRDIEAVHEYMTYWLLRHMATEDSRIMSHMRGEKY